jgi:hypothetical protein
MHAIELMLINYLTKFYNSKLCVKIMRTSYDIPKTESYVGTFCFRKWKFAKRKNRSLGAPSDRSLVSSAPYAIGVRQLKRQFFQPTIAPYRTSLYFQYALMRPLHRHPSHQSPCHARALRDHLRLMFISLLINACIRDSEESGR